MMSLVRQHRGRVVDDLADGLLAEFPSAIDAVACAVQTQRDIEARNLDYAEAPAMRFRIGCSSVRCWSTGTGYSEMR